MLIHPTPSQSAFPRQWQSGKCTVIVEYCAVYFIMSPPKKRKYNDEYIKYGFVAIQKNDADHPQCVICYEVLSNDAMRPGRLERHLSTKHSALQNKPKEYFVAKSETLKRMKFDSAGSFAQSSEKVLEASYELSLLIAKAKKSHTVGETLVKPCLLKASDIVLGPESRQKLSQIPLSDNTVKRRIDDMAEDIKNQVIDAVKQSPFFAIQLDESTDVAQCSQLLVFVRYIQDYTIRDEILFSTELTTTTKAVDVMSAVTDFFGKHDLSWHKLIGVCTDGAPSMLGSRSGFVQLVREKNPSVTAIHCVIHRQALAAKTLPSDLNDVLKLCIKVVNYIKKSALSTRLFTAFCDDLGTEHKTLLFHTEVRWLSKGNMLARLFELRDEVILFLEKQEQDELCTKFREPGVQIFLAYLSDIFDSLNYLNLKLQGGDANIIFHRDAITAYVQKLQLWSRKILAEPCSYSCFSKLCTISEEMRFKEAFEDTDIKTKISNHLQHLIDEFKRYFPNSCEDNIYRLATDPFHIDVDSLPENLQEQALEIKNDSAAKYDFEKIAKTLFWVKYLKVYPDVSEQALRLYLPFSSTYLCEKAFSAVVAIKTKYRSKLDIASDLRCAVCSIPPRIGNLVKNMQAHPSH